MAYRLALAMKRLDVDQMLDEMTPQQFDGWRKYYEIEPFGWWALGKEILRYLRMMVYEQDITDEEVRQIVLAAESQFTEDPHNEQAFARRYGNGRNNRG